MKRQAKLKDYQQFATTANTMLLVTMALVVLMLALITATSRAAVKNNDDAELSAEISKQLNAGPALNFPSTVKRFYSERQFKPNWLGTDTDRDKTWAAMLMLDCVLQFGLNHADYHGPELLPSDLHAILENNSDVKIQKKAHFEIVLTDALFSFINNVHFGKYNPQFSAAIIDKGGLKFDALTLLNQAMAAKDFMAVIITAQPQDKLYQKLQARMHMVAGVQLGDCYEFPEADVRKMALNMERLRWAALDTDNFIQVNIPAYKLSFYHKGVVDTFRVVVGKPQNPTPTLNSAIKYFTTAPEWKVPHKIFVKELLPKAIKDNNYLGNNHYSIYNNGGLLIDPNQAYLIKIKQNPARYHATQSSGCDNALGQVVFRFANIYDIYLHDTPEPELFYKSKRALSHGCIRVQHALDFARLLLSNDDGAEFLKPMQKAINEGITKNFYLKKALPIAITYITCDINDGTLVKFDDVYGLDNSLDMLMYKKDDPTLNITQN